MTKTMGNMMVKMKNGDDFDGENNGVDDDDNKDDDTDGSNYDRNNDIIIRRVQEFGIEIQTVIDSNLKCLNHYTFHMVLQRNMIILSRPFFAGNCINISGSLSNIVPL